MHRSRFMVIKARDLGKGLLFALVGVVLILLFVRLVLGGGEENALYRAGSYCADLALDGEDLQVQVTVSEEAIEEVTLLHNSETLPVFYPLFTNTMESLAQEIVTRQSVAVELPDEAGVTGQLILDAVAEALGRAALD